MNKIALLLAMLLASYTAQADGYFDINSGTGVNSGMTFINNEKLVIEADGVYTIYGNGLPTDNCIEVANSVTATVTLHNVNIDASAKPNTCAFDMTGATVTLILEGNNSLGSGEAAAGLQLHSGATLDIRGDGSLTVSGGADAAGIGSSRTGGLSGAITIYSGNIEATGGENGAGIGGGNNGNVDITVNGGNITALGGENGAGIGTGRDGDGSDGTVTINGGHITAIGGDNGAGIGGGYDTYNTAYVDVAINGGHVIAVGGGTAAGIGDGADGTLSMRGNAFVDASSVSDATVTNKTGGILFDGSAGTIFGSDIVLSVNATVPAGKTLTVPADKKLIIAKDITLTNEGTIINDGAIDNCNGTLTGNAVTGIAATCEFVTLPTPSAGHIIYVKPDGAGDGSSWENAYPNLADPLLVAKSNPDIRQIWVAEGTYKPLHRAGNGTTDRYRAFVLDEGLKIYGGFKAPLPPEGGSVPEFGTAGRDGMAILSGDIDNTPADITGNAYHVVLVVNLSDTAVLDGFTVTGGNANGFSSSFIVNRDTLSLNSGGGIYNSSSSFALANVTVSENTSFGNGGGILNYNSSPTLTNVTVSGNTSYNGGGIYNQSSSPTLTNVIVSGDSASFGGGIFNNNSEPTLINVIISGNTAGARGGGIYDANSTPSLTNVRISGNMAHYYGGGMYSENSTPSLVNVTVGGNRAVYYGDGMFNNNSSPRLYNTIVWGNGTEDVHNIFDGDSDPQYYYSLVKDVTEEDADGNLDGSGGDPMFAFPEPASNAPTDAGDYTLQSVSIAIGSGSNALYLDARGIGSFTGETDLTGNARRSGATIDMGAYEYQTLIPAYGISFGSLLGGSVTADNDAYMEGETVTLTVTLLPGYVLNSINVVRTDDMTTVVELAGSGNTRTFEMPAYGATVTATFGNPDRDALESAKSLVEGGYYFILQEEANTVDELKYLLAATIAELPGVADTEVTVMAFNITIAPFTAASDGTNGSFIFTAMLTKGFGSTTTALRNGVIVATPVVDADTPNIVGHPASATVNTDAVVTLNVTATIDDGGMLSYQWYGNDTDSNAGGTAIAGATSANYLPPTAAADTVYYYVTVTNTNTDVNGIMIASATSNTATVAVNTLVNAATPVIGAQPRDTTVAVGGNAILSASATVSDGGTLSWQWYKNTVNSNASGTAIAGATGASYSPPTATTGTAYYYVAIKNTNDDATGTTTATVTSLTATVTVNATVNARTPVISSHPQNVTVTAGGSATLSVTATVGDGGVLSCQWYVNTVNGNAGGTVIAAATGMNYSPPATAEGTMYYYAVITNTNIGVNGTTTATATSNAAAVTVNSLVNAAVPNIAAHPRDTTVNVGSSVTLSVSATAADGGTLSYQWYGNTANSNVEGVPVIGAADASYLPQTTTAGTMYYYVKVTNTKSGATGDTTATATSVPAKVTVTAIVNAQTPTIVNHPQSVTVTSGDALTVRVTATVDDGGTLSYQWYANTENSNAGGTAIGGAINVGFSPPTIATGTTYYYVVVTNTNPGANGTVTASATSNAATVTVNSLVNAAMPNISAQPQGATVNAGSAVTLNVTATVGDGGTLSYQWYGNTANTNVGGIPIAGAASTSYYPQTTTAGATYYYVEVTNTNTDATGIAAATATSNPAKVTVNTLVNAATPVIAVQPHDTTAVSIDAAVTLGVTATVGDGGTLSYQWYVNAANSNAGGAAIAGATTANYTPPTSAVDTAYYYVTVTNTNSSANGATTASVTSLTATVIVNSVVNAAAPTISVQPQSISASIGDSVVISVTATVGDGGTLSYQWYRNTVNTNAGGTAIADSTRESFTPPTATAGISFYYVEVTNTNADVNGVQTATAASYVAAVIVSAPSAVMYDITIAPTTNGILTTPTDAAAEGTEITVTLFPASGYELDNISVTGTVAAGVVTVEGTGNTRTFTMPAYGVTIATSFRKTQAQLDEEAVVSAKAAIEGGTYRIAQLTGNNEAEVGTWLVNTLNILYGNLHGIQFRSAGVSIIADVAISNLVPAVAGTETDPSGTNGSFTYTVSLEKGASNATATAANGVIIAEPHASAPVYSLDLLPGGDYTFIPATVGYVSQTPYTVVAANVGNRPTGTLPITLGGDNADAFTLSITAISSMEAGDYAFFSITPKVGLAVGRYTATVTTGNANIADATFTVSFTVDASTDTDAVPETKVWSHGNTLYIYSAADATAKVYNTAGLTVATLPVAAGETVGATLARGVYIVLVDGVVHKIVVK